MLEKEDLLAIAKLIAESDERMCARMDSSITASEERTNARIDKLAQDLRQETSQIKQDTIQAASVMMESYFEPKFKLLAENQQIIMETMVPKSRVDDLEDEVKFIKVMVRQMGERISRLEKAN